MPTATSTVHMDEQGRVTIPKPARKKLGMLDESGPVEVEVRVDE